MGRGCALAIIAQKMGCRYFPTHASSLHTSLTASTTCSPDRKSCRFLWAIFSTAYHNRSKHVKYRSLDLLFENTVRDTHAINESIRGIDCNAWLIAGRLLLSRQYPRVSGQPSWCNNHSLFFILSNATDPLPDVVRSPELASSEKHRMRRSFRLYSAWVKPLSRQRRVQVVPSVGCILCLSL